VFLSRDSGHALYPAHVLILSFNPDCLPAAPRADADTTVAGRYKERTAASGRNNKLKIGGAGFFAAAGKCFFGRCSIDGS
jgi:hypothetical protein